nr:hypothetical protein TetV2_00129 [Oceanusvirus sp.]
MVIAASAAVRVFATTQKTRDDRVRFRRLGDRLKTIAREEKRYVERQCRWLTRQHSRTQSSFKKIIEEVKAEMDEIKRSRDTDLDDLDERYDRDERYDDVDNERDDERDENSEKGIDSLRILAKDEGVGEDKKN